MTLTQEQEAVCACNAQIVAVSAGPGSGKTTTITELIKRFTLDELSKTAILTFTTDAAAQIKRKIDGAKPMFAGTIHAYCMSLINREGKLIGLNRRVTAIDQGACDELLVECVAAVQYNGDVSLAKEEIKLNPKVPRKALREVDGKQVSTMITPEPIVDRLAFNVAHLYHQRLLDAGMIDFDAMLTYGLHLIRSGAKWVPQILLVDEVQDSCLMEWDIYRAIRAKRNYLVGDIDQSIYRWKGSNPEEFLRVAINPRSTVKYITKNYRSGPVICDAATNLISNNRVRLPKKVVSSAPSGGAISPMRYAKDEFELKALKLWAESMVGKDAAILCRWNRGCDQARKLLQEAGVKIQGRANRPSRLGAALAFLAACNDPSNEELVYMWLKKSKGKKTADGLRKQALASMTPLAGVEGDIFPEGYIEVEGLTVSVLIAPEDQLEFVLIEMSKFGSEVEEFVDLVKLSLDDGASISDLILACAEDLKDQKSEGIVVSTIHRAKGLEWDYVLLPFWAQSVFPGRKVSEEERCLAFVAVTRARKEVVITCALSTSSYPGSHPSPTEMSQFVKEMKL